MLPVPYLFSSLTPHLQYLQFVNSIHNFNLFTIKIAPRCTKLTSKTNKTSLGYHCNKFFIQKSPKLDVKELKISHMFIKAGDLTKLIFLLLSSIG